MPRLLFRSTVEIRNPESIEDSVEVTTVGFTAPEDMALADALEALGIEPGEWAAHKELPAVGTTALWVLVQTR